MMTLAEKYCLKHIFRLTDKCTNVQFASGLLTEKLLANPDNYC